MIIAYFGGHGATTQEKQLFLLNDSNSKNVPVTAEVKLRHLAIDEFNCAHVCSIFDCCRVPLENMTGLVQGKGFSTQGEDDPPDYDDQ